MIVDSIMDCCKNNEKKAVQLGVIKENINALKFWENIGFKTFTEINNGELDLFIMEKEVI